MKLKYGAAVVLYNPTKDQIENLLVYQNLFEILFIFDNSDNTKKWYSFDNYKNVVYISENKNLGLPIAFNKIIYSEKCKNLDFLCTLDQDSLFYEEEILKMIKKIESINDIEKYGIISPYVNYGNEFISRTDTLQNKKWVITSGSFINLKNLYKNNIYFDENYFIDRCDIDLCKQFLEKKYIVCMYLNSFLFQKLGDSDKKNHSNHSIVRHYYIFRNRFYYNSKWHKLPERYLYDILQTIKHVISILFYEKNKIEKLRMLHKAFKDYKCNKMGKIEL